MRVLLYGTDARTDALAGQCLLSRHRPTLFGYSEISVPGLIDKCRGGVEFGSLTDLAAMVEYARAVRPDLVIIGPEGPLGAGLADAILELGIPCFGPREALARVETSKTWTRTLAAEHGVEGAPTFTVVDDLDQLADVLASYPRFVVKPDGLTGGKGVRVLGEQLQTVEAAHAYAAEMLEQDGIVLIEECLEGQEFSLMSLTDGETVVHCPVVQDHKRAYDGDTGPNTGGMGSYSCADFSLPFLSGADIAQARLINEQMVQALRGRTGLPYQGVLYGGFMATADGVRLIEYNARFGDPEAMNVLPLLTTDFVDVCLAVATGTLAGLAVEFAPKATVCKYVVPKGYPDVRADSERLVVPEELADVPGLRCFWAASETRDGGTWLTNSRAVAFVGIADSLEEAERLAEHGASQVGGPVRHRKDIGTAIAVQARVEHMQRLRSPQPAGRP